MFHISTARKFYDPAIFGLGQFEKVYSSIKVCHLVIRGSLCKSLTNYFVRESLSF